MDRRAFSARSNMSGIAGNSHGWRAPTGATSSRSNWSGFSGFRPFRTRPSNSPRSSGQLRSLPRLTEFAGLCGIAFCIGAGAALLAESPPFWTTNGIATRESQPQLVDRAGKGDRLNVRMKDPSTRAADTQGGFGGLDVAGPLNAVITIRDADGRLVFKLDPQRRTTVIFERGARDGPSPAEQDEPAGPKSRVVPADRPSECDPPGSRLAGSGVLRLVVECYSRIPSRSKWQASLTSRAG
jgi:hypothetical protein